MIDLCCLHDWCIVKESWTRLQMWRPEQFHQKCFSFQIFFAKMFTGQRKQCVKVHWMRERKAQIWFLCRWTHGSLILHVGEKQKEDSVHYSPAFDVTTQTIQKATQPIILLTGHHQLIRHQKPTTLIVKTNRQNGNTPRGQHEGHRNDNFNEWHLITLEGGGFLFSCCGDCIFGPQDIVLALRTMARQTCSNTRDCFDMSHSYRKVMPWMNHIPVRTTDLVTRILHLLRKVLVWRCLV